jgi:NTE family protein
VIGLENLPRPLAYVMGGGGSLGAAQVGMLTALDEVGLRPDMIVGTSVGAGNGALAAEQVAGAPARLREIWALIYRDIVFPHGARQQVKMLEPGRTHLFDNSGLRRFAESHFVHDRIEELPLRFAAVATDIDTAEPVVLTEGPLIDALLASAAIPAVLPAIEVDGRRLCDGGVVANVPVLQALELGAKSMVVLDVKGAVPPAWGSYIEVLTYTLYMAQNRQRGSEIPLAAAQVPVVYLPLPRVARKNMFDFSQTTALMDDAYPVSAAFLQSLEIPDGQPALYGGPGNWPEPPPSADAEEKDTSAQPDDEEA